MAFLDVQHIKLGEVGAERVTEGAWARQLEEENRERPKKMEVQGMVAHPRILQHIFLQLTGRAH